MIRIIFSLALFFLAQAYAGDGAGNGGDYIGALKAAGIYNQIIATGPFPSETIARYRNDFLNEAIFGLIALQRDGKISFVEIDSVMEAFNLIECDESRFELRRELSLDGQEVTAKNFADGRIQLNPKRWNEVSDLFDGRFANKVKRMIAAHEILSLAGLEKTGNYDISKVIIIIEEGFSNQFSDGTSPVFERELSKQFRRDWLGRQKKGLSCSHVLVK